MRGFFICGTILQLRDSQTGLFYGFFDIFDGQNGTSGASLVEKGPLAVHFVPPRAQVDAFDGSVPKRLLYSVHAQELGNASLREY